MSGVLRRRILIDRLQYRLLVANLVYFLIICVVFASVLFGPLIAELLEGPTLSVKAETAATTFVYLDTRLWAAMLALLVVLGFHSVIVSHRIAGPLYRFRKSFEAATQGDLSDVRIRDYDYLKKEARTVNEMFAAIRGRVARAKTRCGEAERLVNELREIAGGAGAEDVRERAEELSEKIEELRSCLQTFKVDPQGADECTPQPGENAERALQAG